MSNLLQSADWPFWKAIRLEALNSEPTSFASSYEEELSWNDSKFEHNLRTSDIFWAFVGSNLVACAGFYSLSAEKTKHKGILFGMYTKPKFRGQGFAGSLITEVINHAKSKKNLVLQLKCVTSNFVAVNFYKQHGFEIYGTETIALKIKDNFFDEHLMMLDLR